MTATPNANLALMLSGGGARGAYQVGVMRRSAGNVPPQCRILNGVSAGASMPLSGGESEPYR